MLHRNMYVVMLTTLYINREHTIPYVLLLSFSCHIYSHCLCKTLQLNNNTFSHSQSLSG